MAIMDVSVAQAKNDVPKLIRAVEAGGRGPASVRFGTMRGRVSLKPGWDRPLTAAEFLSGEF